MKTLELELKKKVLIVDENDFDYYELFKDGIYIKLANGDRDYIEGNFEFLCKGSNLTEEIASELIDENRTYTDSIDRKWYINFLLPIDGKMYFDNALESFISAVESKGFYWLENPIYKILVFLGNISKIDKQIALQKQERRWQEAEEKTFRNPLIFVKK